jgi:hypothetical protein
MGPAVEILITCSDDPYTIEQLQDIRMNALIVRPMVDKLYDPKDLSIGK